MPALSILVLLAALLPGAAFAASPDEVKPKWRTPFDLYLTPREALRLKSENPQTVLLIDVRTRSELKFIGIADAVDANIPVRFLREDFAWSKKSNTYRTRKNPDFVAAVERLLQLRNLDRDTPIILMCQSGSRAPMAARLLHEAGFGKVYTQYQGFEGQKAKSGPKKGQRVVNGWKNADLPWGYNLDPARMYFNFAPAAAE